MACVKDVPIDMFIAAYAEHLKESDKVDLPEWVDVVKTGYFKQLAPESEDWYFIRAASICRKLYVKQNIGVGMFRKLYGGKDRRSVRPGHAAIASSGLIRNILQQLEKLGYVEKSEAVKGGRRLTNKGRRDMDLVAGGIDVPKSEL
ncbi:hypothetical protein BSKO_09469 [Bryopsis sp. KO-2023]|nr:hypothetical protein BSKO_09469 [Bryopsis sp. KO-2023]